MSAVVSWVLAHSAVLAGLVVGLLDFLFALSPGLAANGLLHWLYLQAKGLVSPSS